MGNRIGSNVGIYVGIEDSYGAGQATPNLFQIPRSGLRVHPVDGSGESSEINPNPNPAEPLAGTIDLNGELGQVVSADCLPLLLNLMFGNATKTGASAPYSWETKLLANAMKSAIVEKYDSANAKADLIKGVIVYSLKLSYRKAAEALVATWGFMGIGAAPTRNGGSQFDSSPTVFTDRRHSMKDVTLLVDGAATLAPLVTQFDISFTFEAVRQDGLTGNAFADGMDKGACTIEASLRARRPAADSIYALANGAEHTFKLTSPRPGAATRYFELSLPECYVKQTEPADESGKGPVDEVYKVIPFYSNNADSTAAKFTVANDQSAY